MRFRTTLDLNGKTATGMRVPEDVVAGLGGGKRPPVRVTLRGYTYRTTVAVMGGEYLIGLNADHRAASGAVPGEVLDVEIELDTAPREVTMPADFAAALDAEPEARRFYDGISYSNRRWHVLSIEGAKTTETRQRRIAKSVDLLRAGRPQG
jgi:hypothetical protein